MKLVFVLDNEVIPYEVDQEIPLEKLQNHFEALFSKEMQVFVDHMNSDDFKGLAYDKKIKEIFNELLCGKIFKNVYPYFSHGDLTSGWVGYNKKENLKMKPEIPNFKVYTIENWFEKSKK